MLNPDFAEMLSALSAEGADFMLVGAYAMAAHGVPRATGDIDIWVRPTLGNARRVWRALRAFGAPLFGLTIEDLSHSGTVFQIGVPPSRIDLLTSIDGVEFRDAWRTRITCEIDGITVSVPSREALIRNKRACGRAKDVLDVKLLEQSPAPYDPRGNTRRRGRATRGVRRGRR